MKHELIDLYPRSHFEILTFKHILLSIMNTSIQNIPSLNLHGYLQVSQHCFRPAMAWFQQTIRHHPNQCWPSPMTPYGVTGGQRSKQVSEIIASSKRSKTNDQMRSVRKIRFILVVFCVIGVPIDIFNISYVWDDDMMTSSNGNIFRVTGHLCGEFTGLRWILHTKASDAQLWLFLWSAPE